LFLSGDVVHGGWFAVVLEQPVEIAHQRAQDRWVVGGDHCPSVAFGQPELFRRFEESVGGVDWSLGSPHDTMPMVRPLSTQVPNEATCPSSTVLMTAHLS
jgi:hypothetical protein